MDLNDLHLLLNAFLPFLTAFIFLMLVVAGWFVARKYGALTAYVAFVWVIPLLSIFLLKWGEQLGFWYTSLSTPYALGFVFVSFVVGVVCLPLILYLNWRQLSALKIVGVVLCGLLHSFPFLLFVIVVSVLVFGEVNSLRAP